MWRFIEFKCPLDLILLVICVLCRHSESNMSKAPFTMCSGPLKLGGLLLLSLPMSGCMGPSVPLNWAESEPVPEEVSAIEVGSKVYERHDPETGALLRRWYVKTGSDGLPFLDGTDEGWWPDGSKRHERRWALGEEAGVWQSWHPNGVSRSCLLGRCSRSQGSQVIT